MFDIAAISAGFSGMNTSLNLLKAAVDVRDTAKIAAAVAEVQGKLLTTQTSVFAAHAAQADLIQQVSVLKKQIADLEAWETEKKRYQLEEVGTGAYAYVLKPETADGEPAHWICTNCYQTGKKGLLQGASSEKRMYMISWACPICKNDISVRNDISPSRRPQLNP